MRALLVSMALVWGGAAFAQQSQTQPTQSPSPPPGARPDTPAPASLQFRAMDGNNDGLVSSGEFDDVARSMFDAMDGDDDDRVTLEEMEVARSKLDNRAVALSPGVAARKIRELDANADGVLSRTEHRDGASAMFRGADQDNDGNLTTQEFESRYAEVIASLAA